MTAEMNNPKLRELRRVVSVIVCRDVSLVRWAMLDMAHVWCDVLEYPFRIYQGRQIEEVS